MGGLVFANVTTASGLSAQLPRLPPELYHAISAQCQSQLETLFDRVVVPRDAPAKRDFGDVDYLVGGLKTTAPSRNDLWTNIKDLLGAELYLARGDSHSYGIPHPEISGAYVQVDVELSPGDGTPDGAELFEWTRFMKGDSDLLQIVGVSHRSLGITCNDLGLHIRVEEIEPYNKKKSLLFLTRDPNKAMEFYGFDVIKYWAGFTDETELFDWATSGRFFSHDIFAGRVEKSNDRSRQAKRPMYARFVEEYMPAHPDTGASNAWTRQQVLEEALDMFNKHAEYNAMIEEHRTKVTEEQLWKDIRTVLPVKGDSLGFAIKALKRCAVFDNGELRIAAEPILVGQQPWTKFVTTPETKSAVLDWVKDHWQEAMTMEKARAAAAKAAGMAT